MVDLLAHAEPSPSGQSVADPTRLQAAPAPHRRVLLVQRRLPGYRVALFERLRAALARRGIDLIVGHGGPSPRESLKHDEGQLPGALDVVAHYLGERLCWQPFRTRGCDLVIVSQENRLLFNHWLLRPGRSFKLAFFGHGANLAAERPDSWQERYKRFTTNRVDWWFAYTQLSRDLVQRAGYPAERITVLNNAVDTASVRAQVAAVPLAERAALSQRLGLTPGQTGLFVGSLYAGKSLELLIEAGARCAEQVPGFRLVIVGDGEAAPLVRAATDRYPWLHWAGALHGAAKAPYLAVADFMLMPASVGLAILDGFAAGLPIVATEARGHGPEIVYLEPGENGALTRAEVQAYASAVLHLLQQPDALAALRDGARRTGERYTLDAMVEAFAQGIEAALAAPRLA